MISDIISIMWKEAHELLSGAGRGKFAPIILLVIYGVVFPLQSGSKWVDSYQMVGFGLGISVFMVLSIVADSIAGERERHTLETLLASRLSDQSILAGKITTVVIYGWGLTMTSLVVGLIAVNVTSGAGHLLLYPGGRAAATAVLSLLLAILSTGIGVLVSLRASTVRQAQQILTIGWVAVFFAFFFGAQSLPPSTRAHLLHWLNSLSMTAAAVVLIILVFVLDLIVLAIDTIKFQRARLILD